MHAALSQVREARLQVTTVRQQAEEQVEAARRDAAAAHQALYEMRHERVAFVAALRQSREALRKEQHASAKAMRWHAAWRLERERSRGQMGAADAEVPVMTRAKTAPSAEASSGESALTVQQSSFTLDEPSAPLVAVAPVAEDDAAAADDDGGGAAAAANGGRAGSGMLPPSLLVQARESSSSSFLGESRLQQRNSSPAALRPALVGRGSSGRLSSLRRSPSSWSKMEVVYLEQQRELERLRAAHAEAITQLANAKLAIADAAFANGLKAAAEKGVVYL
mmetsp:Transcript_71051/g.213706  ORF Transcript_71051/g.213706 Transcript_71051/m.213706 type:complete len:279 (-) Transcript_71051:180-1016(-)